MLPLFAVVGGYAAIKGSISEKLSMRLSTGLGEGTGMARPAPPPMPPGLDDPRWDFSPKEEAGAPGRLGLASATALAARRAAEATCWAPIPLACWGAWIGRRDRRRIAGRFVAGVLAVGFSAVLVRHAMRAGYLSDRHCLLLVVAMLPIAASGLLDLGRRLADRRMLSPSRRHRIAFGFVLAIVAAGFAVQAKPGHPSRWGHREAGLWVAAEADPGDAVLDTRGWAAFSSGLRSYGPWHLRQAITDAKLRYIIITDDELRAGTRRAETLAALLDHAAEPAAAFPERRGGTRPGVLVYRYRRPESWEGIAR
jgi:hypothetical protein